MRLSRGPQSFSFKAYVSKVDGIGDENSGTSLVKYSPTVGKDDISRNQNVMYNCISFIKEYADKSLEELRLEDYKAGRVSKELALGNFIYKFNTAPASYYKSPVKKTGALHAYEVIAKRFETKLFVPKKRHGVGEQYSGTTIVKYSPNVGLEIVEKAGRSTKKLNVTYICISIMKEYENKSLEELRLEDYRAGRNLLIKYIQDFYYKPKIFVFGFKEKHAFTFRDKDCTDGLSKGTALVKYTPTLGTDVIISSFNSKNINVKYNFITAMKEYDNKSLEELRLEDYRDGRIHGSSEGSIQHESCLTSIDSAIGLDGVRSSNQSQVEDEARRPDQVEGGVRRSDQVEGGSRRSEQVESGVRCPDQVEGGVRRPDQVEGGVRRPDQVEDGVRRPDQVEGGVRRSEQVEGGVRRSEQVEGGVRGSEQVESGVRRPDQVEGGVRRPDQVEDGVRRPDQVEGGVRRSEQVEDGVRRPEQVEGGVRRSEQVEGGVRRTEQVEGGVRRPDQVEGGVRRSEQVEDGVRRPDQVEGGVRRSEQVEGGVRLPDLVKGGVRRPDQVKGGVRRPDQVVERARSSYQCLLFDDLLLDQLSSLSVIERSPVPKHMNPVPLSLHRTKGKNIRLSDGGIAARYHGEYCQGYVFSARPMHPGKTITAQILQTDNSNRRSLTIGLTSCDPATIEPDELPDEAKFLQDRPEYWIIYPDAATGFDIGDELNLTLTLDGKLEVSKNGLNVVEVLHVDHTLKLWAFFDVYGATEEVRLFVSELVKQPDQVDGAGRPDQVEDGARRPDQVVNGARRADQVVYGARYSDQVVDRAKRFDQIEDRARRADQVENRARRSDQMLDRPRRSDQMADKVKHKSTNAVESIPSTSKSNVEPRTECTICFDNRINCAIYKCGHMCMCYDCAVQQWKNDGKSYGKCPICRAKIQDVIRIYSS